MFSKLTDPLRAAFTEVVQPAADDPDDGYGLPAPATETCLRDEQGRLKTRIVHHAGNCPEINSRTEYRYDKGALRARVEIKSIQDCEGNSYSEHWYDAADRLHRDDGPAVTARANHHIPEETHLDESRREFWRHGELVDQVDTTYEDIVSHKPLTVRQAFGYDV